MTNLLKLYLSRIELAATEGGARLHRVAFTPYRGPYPVQNGFAFLTQNAPSRLQRIEPTPLSPLQSSIVLLTARLVTFLLLSIGAVFS